MLCPSTVRMYRKVCAIYALTFFILLPLLCNKLPYSKYYMHNISDSKRINADARRVELENQERVAASKFYLKQNGPYSRTFRQLRQRLERTSKPDLAITVVTVARRSGGKSKPDPQYLTQVVARFAELLTQQKNVIFQVCNVNTPPESHREAVYLSKYVPVISRNSSFAASEQPTSVHKFEKEKQDYVFCMEQSLQLQPNYLLMVQDDAVPRTDFFPVFQHLLKYNIEGKIVHGDLQTNPEKWAFWKLYYPERWQGYGNEGRLFLELVCSGLIGGSLFVALNCCGVFTDRDSRRRTTVFVLGFFYAVLLCLAIGRQYLIELRRLSAHTYTVVDAPDCCIPAVLYSPEQVADIVQYLKGVTCSSLLPIDLALDKYVHSSGLKQYLVEPNLFHHIGIVSTLHAGIKNPWDF